MNLEKLEELVASREIVTLVFERRNGPEEYDVVITWVEDRTDHLYLGYRPLSWKHGQWGHVKCRETPKRFGLQRIEPTGRVLPNPPPLRSRTYDEVWGRPPGIR